MTRRIAEEVARSGASTGPRALSLLCSNAKTRWIEEWRPAAAPMRGARRPCARPILTLLIEHYLGGFAEELDSFYPGINGLAMLTIQINLAKALPDIWAEDFDDGDAAVAALKACERRAGRIAATLQLAVGNDDKVTRYGEKFDIWKEMSRADLSFLTADWPGQVATAYRKVLANANPFEKDAARRNLLLFRELRCCPQTLSGA